MDIRLVELEQRACHLDKVSTSTKSSIAQINDRNRNIEETEMAIILVLKRTHNPKMYEKERH